MVVRHLEYYEMIMQQNKLGSFPVSFVPAAFNHGFGIAGYHPVSLAELLAPKGIDYINTPFYKMQHADATESEFFGMDAGILTVNRGRDLLPWHAIGTLPARELKGGTCGMHWPNILHPDPEFYFFIVYKFLNMIKVCRLFVLLVIPGMLFLGSNCSFSFRDKNFKTNELNLIRLKETAVQSAKWSLDNNLDHMSYQAMCAAYGILKVAAVTGNDSLRKVVERVFRPELLEGVSPHRDNATDYPPHQWFGFVPLELYRQTENPRYLERGIEMAEEQFKDPDENGMPSYTSRMYVDDIYGDPHGQAPLLWVTSSLLEALQE